MKKILACLLAVIFLLPIFPNEKISAEEPFDITDGDITEPPAGFIFPENMKGVCITPTVDFVTRKADGSGYTEEEVYSEMNRMFLELRDHRMNTVIIGTDTGGVPLYGEDSNRGINKTIVEYAADEALDRGFYVYLTFNVRTALDTYCKNLPYGKRINKLALIIRNFILRNDADGIIFEDYYSSAGNAAFCDYMRSGSGIGYENWIKDSNEYLFSVISEAVHRTSSRVSVGIAVDGASVLSSDDTAGYIGKGSADFIVLRTKGGFSSETEPYEDVVSQCNERALLADIPMFVLHENQYSCTGKFGWDYPDELVKQVIRADSLASCKGSAFASFSALKEDRQQSTEALLKNYRGDLYAEGLDNVLEMTLPEAEEFRTDDASVIFAGSFDPNFTVYFQGEPIELNKAGRFYFNMDLEVGKNTFTFENKGRKITYSITRTLRVLRNAEPRGEDIIADGGSEIMFSAVAYKGSSVMAYINGTKVKLNEAEGLSDDIDPNSSYTKYTGVYKLPEGVYDRMTDLGNVKIYGAYPTKDGSILECITGCRICVNAKPRPAPAPEVKTIESVKKASPGGLIAIRNNNTVSRKASDYSSVPTPDNTRLPAGTLDYVTRTAYYGGTEYYITASGRRIRTVDAVPASGAIPSNNPIAVTQAGIIGRDTVITFDMPCKVPFTAEYGGLDYSWGANGSYYVKEFNADRICIIFDYISEVTTGSFRFPEGAVFSEGRWDSFTENGLTKHRLVLKLSEKGVYYGMSSEYNENGSLVMTFNGNGHTLSGTTIVIDPGHGYVGGGKFDPGAVGHVREQAANLAISRLLEQKLTAAGANVIRYRTESENYVTPLRAETARQYHPDIYVAVHCNSGGSSSSGAEAYYFTPFSQPLADKISRRLGKVLSDVHGGGNFDRGEKYNYFYVTQQQDFPSVLAETAFVSNYTEAMALADPEWQEKFAEAVYLGIEDYLTGR